VAASRGAATTLYVADTGSGNTVWVMDAQGNSLSAFPMANTPVDLDVDGAGNVFVADTSYYITKYTGGSPVTQFGGCCGGSGTFSYLRGVGTDTAGNLYAVDNNYGVIEKFDNNGNYLKNIGGGLIYSPMDVAVDSSGNIYSSSYNEVDKFSSTGSYLTYWSSWTDGNTTDYFNGLGGIAIDGTGKITVADQYNYSLDTFGP